MRALVRARKALTREHTLEEGLAKLMEFGRPYLHCAPDLTWSCNVALNTDKFDVDAKLRSGFNHPTPNSAVNACLAKLGALNG